MSIWSRLFSRDRPLPGPPPRDVAALAAPFATTALYVKPAPFPFKAGMPGVTGSWFLGEPVLATGDAWPEFAGRRLGFLACLDLREIQAAHATPWLPPAGSLSFFYDLEKQPWGYDPKDRGSWAVLFRADSPPLAPPAGSRSVQFRAIKSYPPAERPEIAALNLTDDESDLYADLVKAQIGVDACHQVGGFPSLIQNDDLELVSQLASNGVYCGDTKGMNSDRGRELAAGAGEWRLLLQLVSDESLHFLWGDAGNLYFMIREADALAGRFDRVWLQSQCF